MSADLETQLHALLDEAAALAEGTSRVALLEEAVRLADTHGQVELGFDARQKLIDAATFHGFPEKSLVAFSWCLAQYDRDPERFDEFELLWKYKWVVGSLADFPQVTRAQIESAVEDMARRFQRAGGGLRAVLKLRRRVAIDMGEWDEARRWDAEWLKTPRDWLSDCPACEVDARVEFFSLFHEDEQTVTEAAPILRGSLRCGEVPHRTLSRLLVPLLRLGRPAEAMSQHRRGYRMVSGNQNFLYQVGTHLTFLTLTDNLPSATRAFSRHLPWSLATQVPSRRFGFHLAVVLLLRQLQGGGKDTLSLRLPSNFPIYEKRGRYGVAALLAWFEADLQELADRFNTRNGNDYYSRRIAEHQELIRLRQPFPLKAPGKSE